MLLMSMSDKPGCSHIKDCDKPGLGLLHVQVNCHIMYRWNVASCTGEMSHNVQVKLSHHVQVKCHISRWIVTSSTGEMLHHVQVKCCIMSRWNVSHSIHKRQRNLTFTYKKVHQDFTRLMSHLCNQPLRARYSDLSEISYSDSDSQFRIFFSINIYTMEFFLNAESAF